MALDITKHLPYCYTLIANNIRANINDTIIGDIDHEYITKMNKNTSENYVYNYNINGELDSPYDEEKKSYIPAITITNRFGPNRGIESLELIYLFDGKIIDCIHPYIIYIRNCYNLKKVVRLNYYSSDRAMSLLPNYVLSTFNKELELINILMQINYSYVYAPDGIGGYFLKYIDGYDIVCATNEIYPHIGNLNDVKFLTIEEYADIHGLNKEIIVDTYKNIYNNKIYETDEIYSTTLKFSD